MTLRELRDRINETPEYLLDLEVKVLDRNEGEWLDLEDYTTSPGEWVGPPSARGVRVSHPVLVPGS